MFFKRNRKNEALSKVYYDKLRNEDDLMILCENHLNVSILAIPKYDCSTDECGVLIEKMKEHFCKGCFRSCCSKIIKFCVCKVLNQFYCKR